MKRARDSRWTMTATREVTYEVVTTSDIFDPDNPELGLLPGGRMGGGTRLVVIDEAVERVFGNKIRRYFNLNNIAVEYMTLCGGEENKTIDAVLKVASKLSEIGTDRVGTPPIAIGGGVLQDIVGMTASLYRRGIPYVRVPTTLLGQIDGSVSAKNGVNYEGCRNRLGTFAPPPKTLIDRALLATLPERQIRSGLGEALKVALIKDARLFELLETHGSELVRYRLQDSDARSGDSQPSLEVIQRSITGMAEGLTKNLWESELKRIVDYGHTFSPIVEMRALPKLHHGEAVAMGCLFSAVLAANRGLLNPEQLIRIINTTAGIGLPLTHPLFADADVMKEALADTMRHRDNNQHITFLADIGKTVFVEDVVDAEIERASAFMAHLLQPHVPDDAALTKLLSEPGATTGYDASQLAHRAV
ncbi:sedoheptulose 7-phosphate cyclase [Streptomyces roseus]|uniref:sedoheptulose 7-phosphate cyclase n=1 Tax=Streptomyces roseus TaxID=66430 RepID=UPI0036BE0269